MAAPATWMIALRRAVFTPDRSIGRSENVCPIARLHKTRPHGKMSNAYQLLSTSAAMMLPQSRTSMTTELAACAQAETKLRPPHRGQTAGKVSDAPNFRKLEIAGAAQCGHGYMQANY